jgi:hypothetical protein
MMSGAARLIKTNRATEAATFGEAQLIPNDRNL